MLLLVLALLVQASAQPSVDYARAERFLSYNTNALVLHSGVRPNWLPDDRFWYRTNTENGATTFLIDPVKGTRSTYNPPRRASAPDNSVVSPDGKRAVFIRDYNLWVTDLASGKETQLTKDGVKDFGYATDNAGWTRSDEPVVLWSPDSKRVATFQHDGRGVGEMYLADTRVGHPHLEEWKYPLAGDEKIFEIQRVIIDVDAARVIRLQMPPDPHRSSLCDHVRCADTFADVEWSGDSRQLAFISSSRDHKHARFRVADAATGKVRDVFEETAKTYFEGGDDRPNWRFLPMSNEFIWFSERDNWGQLYLYDLTTGKLKNQITTGEGDVVETLRVDEKNRQVYFLAAGKEKGQDPYFQHLYRASLDGKGLTRLTPEDATHEVSISPSGKFFVDSYSKPDVPSVTLLRDMSTGAVIQTLEKADISRLIATGWKPVTPFSVKARDGMTDLYGLMYKPTTFDPAKKYPIIDHIYPGPTPGSVGTRRFVASRGDSQALAELGFIVIELDGMGTPMRSKSFHDEYYGNMGDNTLPDQVAGIQQLARRYPWIDIDRVGIWGHSGGGYAAADAMFRYPDFFKVGISEAGNHDNRDYEDDWAEKWQGLVNGNNYDNQANELAAKNLKGKLLLVHGTMDSNVPPYNTLLVVDALIRANKDFDMLMLPNRDHGFGNEPYMIRKRWDYFVKNLAGIEPPKEYEFRR